MWEMCCGQSASGQGERNGVSKGRLVEGETSAEFSEARGQAEFLVNGVCVCVGIWLYTMIAVRWGAMESSLTAGAVLK